MCGDTIVSYFGNAAHLEVIKIGSRVEPESGIPPVLYL